MNDDIKYILFFSTLISLLFVVAEVAHKFFKVKALYTRKALHISCGLITLFYPDIFYHHLPVLILNILCLLLMIISKRFFLMPSVHSIGRESWGSFLYPVSIYVMFVASLYFEIRYFFYIPVLILAISDPLAEIAVLASKPFRHQNYKIRYVKIWRTNKTYIGSALFFISALLISLIMISTSIDIPFIRILTMSLTITISTTAVEAFSSKGFDNLTIPLAALLVLVLFNT